ncbi:MAG: DUF5320 domain-containing protein [Anaerolineales bacterium]
MPGFDRTGPAGQGPMTGGARGLCNPSAAAYRPSAAARPRAPFFPRVFGGARPRGGRGFGRGGRGRGRR